MESDGVDHRNLSAQILGVKEGLRAYCQTTCSSCKCCKALLRLDLGAVGLAHLADTEKVGGSSPPDPTTAVGLS